MCPSTLPELPEVETVRRGLNDCTCGHTITGGELLRPQTLAYPPEGAALWPPLIGQTLTHWERRGKYLLGQLSDGSCLGVHLRMTGQLLWVDRRYPLGKHTRFRLFLAGDRELRFVDLRTFGQIWLVPPTMARETVITGLKKLAMEPFDPAFTPGHIAQKLQRRDRPIKTILLDQSFVAGLGNIYADEVLFTSGIHPQRPGRSLSADEIHILHRQIQTVLHQAIAKGGTSFSDYLNLLGVQGNYGDCAWVYQRTNQPCKQCGTAIARIKLAGRSSHFCPRCQS